MKKHLQDIFFDHPTIKGNCWQTVLACMTDKEIDEVPHFVDIDENQGGPDWFYYSYMWLWEQGYRLVQYDEYPTKQGTDEPWDGYVMVSGLSPRGDFHHVVIYKDGKLFHDPHPSQAGVKTEVSFEILLNR